MSLFIGSLAFNGDPGLQAQACLGVVAGSILSALLGAAVLAGAQARRGPGDDL
jgi:NhaA family Na+:H+ antiporter